MRRRTSPGSSASGSGGGPGSASAASSSSSWRPRRIWTRGRQVAAAGLALAPRRRRAEGGQALGPDLPATGDAAPGRLGVLHERRVGAVAGRELLGDPRLPALRSEPLREGVRSRQEVADVIGGVLDLRRRERPPLPVGEPLVVAEADADRGLEQPLQRERAAVAREPGRELGVVHPLRPNVVVQDERGQVARRRVHHLLDGRIGHELGHRPERRPLDRVDHGQSLGGRDLDEAQTRRVRPLPHELGVDGAPALDSSGVEQRPELLARGDLLDPHRARQYATTGSDPNGACASL
jgi:hypothetical protein